MYCRQTLIACAFTAYKEPRSVAFYAFCKQTFNLLTYQVPGTDCFDFQQQESRPVSLLALYRQ